MPEVVACLLLPLYVYEKVGAGLGLVLLDSIYLVFSVIPHVKFELSLFAIQ